ncbi:MAG: hypothetical protein JNL13_07425, partial [Chitinophagaceae bacterium]|nr:hypothetical protein [Chitinophagaceae bacterium]
QAFVNHLVYYKQKNRLDDWFYYQLIRKTAQQLCAKEKNFELYTLYKWFLLCKSGFDARLAICDSRLLLYVYSDDNIYDIPFYQQEGKQYVCLNYHDYGSKLDFSTLSFFSVPIEMPEAIEAFSYRVTKMPQFNNDAYAEKDLQFQYEEKNYTFKVLVNTEVQNIFVNYPVVDYEAYFNIPLSDRTYNSLIPELKDAVKGMSPKKGVDYLMRFSRNAFAYKTDQDAFGREKRLSPEQTLLNSSSDCDDRAGLFFALVKEIYNLPMIVVLYPKHVTIAVQFEKAQGKPIVYKERKYYICEPTPQQEDLPIGQVNPKLRHTPYEIAYEYNPGQ